MGRTLQMFERPKVPRLVRMHVSDAGNGVGAIVRYQCSKCGLETDWLEAPSVSECKRGIPCPTCNVVTGE